MAMGKKGFFGSSIPRCAARIGIAISGSLALAFPSMKSGPVGAAEWAAGVAARLRLIQASFADEPPETRARSLQDELEQALKSVTRGQRKEYIEALQTEFPSPISETQNGAATMDGAS